MAWIRDLGLWALAHLIVAGMFHDLEIQRPEGVVAGNPTRRVGPRLVVSNHSNGFVDVVALIVALGHYPRFVARSSLFRRWPLRWLLRAAGAIPIYPSTSDNSSSFREVHRALERGFTVAIFPEGRVSVDEQLQPLRTGAARMLLGAAAVGVDGIRVVPIGLTYMDKIALRTRALARVGPEFALDPILPSVTSGAPPNENDRPTVRRLTDIFQRQLADVSPDFGSLEREARLIRVADMVLRSKLTDAFADPPISASVDLAGQIGHLPEDIEDEILDRAGRYHLELAATSLRDDQVAPPARLRDALKAFGFSALKLAISLPLAFVGFATNLIPALLVIVAGSAIREPVTKGTARIVTALVAFPAAWSFAVWTSGRTGWALTLWVSMLIAGSVLLVVAASAMIQAVDAGVSWRRVRSRRALLEKVLEVRAETVDYVTSALG